MEIDGYGAAIGEMVLTTIEDNPEVKQMSCEAVDSLSIQRLSENIAHGSGVAVEACSDIKVVPLRQLRFTQNNCGMKFRNGLPLQSLVDELRRGTRDPLKDDFLILNVAEVRLDLGLFFYSLDNKRLLCMREAFGKRLPHTRSYHAPWQTI